MQSTLKQPGEVVQVLPADTEATAMKKSPLVRSDRVKVIRLELPAGKILPEHKAPGELTVHCLAGRIEFTTMGRTEQLTPGSLIYLPPGGLHSVEAIEASTILLTIFN